VERQVFESLSLGLVVFDRGMRVSYRNPAADALLPLGSDLAEALHAIVRDPRYPDWTAVLGEVMEHRHKRRMEQVCGTRDPGGRIQLDLFCLPLWTLAVRRPAGSRCGDYGPCRLEKRLAFPSGWRRSAHSVGTGGPRSTNPLDWILRY